MYANVCDVAEGECTICTYANGMKLDHKPCYKIRRASDYLWKIIPNQRRQSVGRSVFTCQDPCGAMTPELPRLGLGWSTPWLLSGHVHELPSCGEQEEL